MENSKHHEKRKFVSIADRVLLAIRTIEEAQALQQQLEEQSQDAAHCTSTSRQLKALDDQLALVLHKLAEKMPQTSKVISLVNKKLDILAHHILKAEAGDEHQEQEISISAAGIGFTSNHSLEIGSLIAIDMMLSPNPYRIIAPARIVACNNALGHNTAPSASEPSYFIRAEFESLSEEDEEILIQHVIRRQSQILKQRRLSREAADEASPKTK